MMLNEEISRWGRNEPWPAPERATSATLPPWLPTAFSVCVYMCLGPRPAAFVAFSLILLTYLGGVMALPLPVQVALSCVPTATAIFVTLLHRGRTKDNMDSGRGTRLDRAARTVTQIETPPVTRLAHHGDGRDRGIVQSGSTVPSCALSLQGGPVAGATGDARSFAAAWVAKHADQPPTSATANMPTAAASAAAGSAYRDFPQADPRGTSQVRSDGDPWHATTRVDSDITCGGREPRSPPKTLVTPVTLVPLMREALEAGLTADGSQSFRARSKARTAAWAAAVKEAAEAEAKAAKAKATDGTSTGQDTDTEDPAAQGVHHAASKAAATIARAAKAGHGDGVGDFTVSDIGAGEKSLWGEMPLTAFFEVMRLVGDSERRSIRLVCREWLSAARACITDLSPPRGALRHLDTLATAFPYITSLDLSEALHHINPSRSRHLAAMRHLSALVLGCPNTGCGPGSRIGFGSVPGCLQISAAGIYPAGGGGGAVAVTDSCVRELALSLARVQRHAAALPGFGSGSGQLQISGLVNGGGVTGGGCATVVGPGSLRPGPLGAPGPSLRVLSLARCVHVSDAGLMSLVHLSSLTSLDLTGCVSVTDVGIMVLARLPALALLDLAWCLKVSNAGLRALAVLPRLVHLGISGCPLVSEAGVRGLTAVSSLRSIDLTYLGSHRAAVTDATLVSLASQLDLTHLALGGAGDIAAAAVVRITDAGLVALADGCPRLEAVTLLGLRDITDVGVTALATSLTMLTALVVRGCGPGVTRGCLAAVSAAVAWHGQRDGSGGCDDGGGDRSGLRELALLYNPSLDLSDEDVARLCTLPPRASRSRASFLLQHGGARTTPYHSIRRSISSDGLYSLGIGGFLGLQLPSAPPPQAPGPGLGGPETTVRLGPASLRAIGRLTWLTSLSLVGYPGPFWAAVDPSIRIDDCTKEGSLSSGASGSHSTCYSCTSGCSGSGTKTGHSSHGPGRFDIRGGVAGMAASAVAASASATVPLASLRQLQYLDVSGAVQLDDVALATIAEAVQGLKTLLLPRCTRITDAGLEAVASQSRELHVLNLSNCHRITDGGLAFLAQLRWLSQLVLKNCPLITDAGISALAPLHRLELLDLAHASARITGAGFAAFSGRRSGTRLASLALSYCSGLCDRGLTAVCAALRGLVRLDVSGCNALTDAGGTSLGHLPLLTDVDLSHCARIGDATLSALAPLRLLTTVKMPGCVRISDEGLAALAAASAASLPRKPAPPQQQQQQVAGGGSSTPAAFTSHNPDTEATSLAIMTTNAPNSTNSTNTTNTINTTNDIITTTTATSNACGISTIGNASAGAGLSVQQQQQQQLSVANATGADGSSSGIISPSPASASPVLCLHLDSCISVTDAGLTHLAFLTSLTSLRLARCAAVTDGGVVALAALTRLCSLSLAHCPAVTQTGLLALSGITSLASLEF